MFINKIQQPIITKTLKQRILDKSRLSNKTSIDNDFIQIFKALNFKDENINQIINDIKKVYSKNRKYHNITHIRYMLKAFEEFMFNSIESAKVKNPSEFNYAILMHDYINGEPDDIAKSINIAEKIWKTNTTKDFSYIKTLITSTDYSKPVTIRTFDEKLMQDLDLKILGSNQDEYAIYSNSVREEFSNYPDEIYRNERIKILNSFLNKMNIYNTTHFQSNYEQQARINIKKEIIRLTY